MTVKNGFNSRRTVCQQWEKKKKQRIARLFTSFFESPGFCCSRVSNIILCVLFIGAGFCIIIFRYNYFKRVAWQQYIWVGYLRSEMWLLIFELKFGLAGSTNWLLLRSRSMIIWGDSIKCYFIMCTRSLKENGLTLLKNLFKYTS